MTGVFAKNAAPCSFYLRPSVSESSKEEPVNLYILLYPWLFMISRILEILGVPDYQKTESQAMAIQSLM